MLFRQHASLTCTSDEFEHCRQQLHALQALNESKTARIKDLEEVRTSPQDYSFIT